MDVADRGARLVGPAVFLTDLVGKQGKAGLLRAGDLRADRGHRDDDLVAHVRRVCRSRGTTQVPAARATTTGGSSRTADDAASPAGRDDLAGLEAHLARRPAHARQLRLDLEIVAGVDRREEVDRGVGAEEPFVAVVPDEELRGGVAEQLQDVRAVDEAARRSGRSPAPTRSRRSDLLGCHVAGASLGAARDLFEQKGGHAARRRARAEPRVVAELLGERVLEASPSGHEDDAIPQALRFQHVDEIRQVLDVDLVLRDGRGDEDRVGLRLAREAHEPFDRHLGPEVAGIEARVALEAVVAGEALRVEDGVDADRVGVGLERAAEDDEPPSEPLADPRVDLLAVEVRHRHLLGRDRGRVDFVDRLAVDDEERELGSDRLRERHIGVADPHLARRSAWRPRPRGPSAARGSVKET